MSTSELISVLSIPSVAIIIAALIVASIISKYIDINKNKIMDYCNTESTKLYVDLLLTTVPSIVDELNQTVVYAMRQAHEDGKLTEDEIKQVNEMAIVGVKNVLNDTAIEVLNNVFNDLDSVIKTLIESSIYNEHQDNNEL